MITPPDLRHCRLGTSFGQLVAVARSSGGTQGLSALFGVDPGEELGVGQLGEQVTPGSDPLLASVATQLDEYFAGERRGFTVPLSPAGSDFERHVWTMVARVPYGTTASYGEIAEQLGNQGLARGVATAIARSPISVIVPCHRVVRSDGSLSGSARGIERRRALLELESHALDSQGSADATRMAP
ncbi:methylated-DNA--[protein]-cysteine S-methyltransferase [Propionibacterium freudenreichii]